jgi:leucyl aminopeptidase
MNISINISADLNESKSHIKIVNKTKKKDSSLSYKFDGKVLNGEVGSDDTLSENDQAENLRRTGHMLWGIIHNLKIKSLVFSSDVTLEKACIYLAEGLLLSSYVFEKYKSEKRNCYLKDINIYDKKVSNKCISTLHKIITANFIARDLVNEPPAKLTATDLSNSIVSLGKEYGFKTTVFNKTEIQSMKMGGLLSVNLGSETPPTFNVLEWKPKEAKNKKPLILIGKGVVYDTGGLSLKPTANSMDLMKSDMAGSAAVIGAFCAIASMNLPLHVIGLIAATDNRPGKNAYAPGDVIHMFDGTSVEVMNTDAEGRLTLADALSYAKKYKPDLVIDIATLTGSAARAIGKEGIVFMGTADTKTLNNLKTCGKKVHERLVQFPLWDDYARQIKSDIADLKNVGGVEAGAITAGKFLEHFTDYPWIHMDIAGSAFLTSEDSYRGKNATGVGVRLIVNFLNQVSNES